MTDTGSPKPKRQSLKDIARRVSTIPPSPDGKVQAKPRTPLDSMRPVSVSEPPPPADRMKELAELANATIGEQPEAATPAQPPVPKPSRPSRLPLVAGIAVGVGAIALSIVVVTRNATPQPQVATSTASLPLSTSAGEVSERVSASGAPQPIRDQADEKTEDRDDQGEGKAGTESMPLEAADTETDRGTPAKAAPSPAAQPDEPTPEEETKTVAPGEAEGEQERPTGLSGAMAAAVGKDAPAEGDKSSKDEGEPGPAAGSVPMTPSQGQVQSALAAVRGAARGCVAGMEEPSRAAVTFGSDGRVSAVSVSGAAAGKPAAACIQSALGNARVPPFKKPAFTVGLTLRP